MYLEFSKVNRNMPRRQHSDLYFLSFTMSNLNSSSCRSNLTSGVLFFTPKNVLKLLILMNDKREASYCKQYLSVNVIIELSFCVQFL